VKNVIYYFTGRGNSLSIAKALAQRTDAVLKPIRGDVQTAGLSGGVVGLTFPVVDMGIPAAVRRFIMNLPEDNPPIYLYAVITCGGMPCASMRQLVKLLKRRGLTLSAGWQVKFGLEKMEDGQWNALIDDIAGRIAERAPVELPAAGMKDLMMTGLINPIARLMIHSEDKKFLVGEECAGCGVCAKICPVSNIKMENGRPRWQHRCEQCAACFSWCPKAAISGSCLAAKTHYTNPGITLEQMLRLPLNEQP